MFPLLLCIVREKISRYSYIILHEESFNCLSVLSLQFYVKEFLRTLRIRFAVQTEAKVRQKIRSQQSIVLK